MIAPDRLDAALRAAVIRLRAARDGSDHWEGRLSSSALATATALSALSVVGDEQDGPPISRGARWLCATQNPDGGWGDTPDSPSNLSTTLLALSALRLSAAGDEATIERAHRYVTGRAGATPDERVAAVQAIYGADRTFAAPILMNCALAGLVPWESVPELPFELAALPQSWYRAVRLQVVSYALPALIAVGALAHRMNPSRSRPRRLARGLVEASALKKLESLQPSNGGFLEATPLTAFVAMSLAAGQCGPEPVLGRCLGFLRASMRPDGSWPIDTHLATWVTTGALNALTVAGAVVADERETVSRWVVESQRLHVHPYTGARPGGWGWSPLAGAVPDADDTSGAILALAGGRHTEAVRAGVRWLLGLQNPDGGWPTFCRGWGRLPFDQSCADITAHALRALVAARAAGEATGVEKPIRHGLAYLRRQQRADGSWVPLWFGNQHTDDHTNPVLGTARVLMAVGELEPHSKMAHRGVQYLLASQGDDGGWGGAAGVAPSVEETALAVSALSHWPTVASEALWRGLGYLVRRVEDRNWTKAAPIGLYFASLWYSEQLYPLIWTVEALGRARHLTVARGAEPPDQHS